MNIDELSAKLEAMRSQGYGRRRIAEALGISEWTARQILKKQARVQPTNPNKMLRVVAAGDTHIPYAYEPAISILLGFLRDYKPDIVVLLGDIVDFYAISRFAKDPGRKTELQSDIDKTAQFLADVRKATPDSRIVYIEGNHSHRLTKYLWRTAPELYSLKVLSLPIVFELDRLEIEMVPYGTEFRIGPLLFVHGDVVRKRAGATAQALLEKYRANVVTGHVHRLGGVYRTWQDECLVGIEAGCLCSLDQEYVHKPDWQHGFVSLQVMGDKDWSFQLHKVNGNRLVTENGIYTA